MSHRIKTGDVRRVLQKQAANSFDACLTDPPYGLSFMGKAWDKGIPPVDVWREVYRVLKPGAMMLAFGGTRTYHRLTCAIEDAGFEIRDCLMWLYGSGFPKSMDISKAIDKNAGTWRGKAGPVRSSNTAMSGSNYVRTHKSSPATDAAKLWDGFGTSLKPAWEPIILAMKPLDGTFAHNAMKHGVAGLNIAAGRIGTDTVGWGGKGASGKVFNKSNCGLTMGGVASPVVGRWPSNVLLDEAAAAALDQATRALHGAGRQRAGGQSKQDGAGGRFGVGNHEGNGMRFGDSGGASRFFYTGKVSTRERGAANNHPTLKPIKLTTYLAKLLLPPHADARLLIPFSGAGSEMLGARQAGWKHCLGIELCPEYVEIAEARLAA